MGRFAKLLTTLLFPVVLLPGFSSKANALTLLDTISGTSFGTNYIFRLYQGSYASIATAITGNTAFGALLSPDQFQAELARNIFLSTQAVGNYIQTDGPNLGIGPLFAFGPITNDVLTGVSTYEFSNGNAQSVTWTSGIFNNSGFSLTTARADIFGSPLVYATYEFSPVPEIDGALLPQAALIAAGLFAWSRRRKARASAG
jgi:hypothetical protein